MTMSRPQTAKAARQAEEKPEIPDGIGKAFVRKYSASFMRKHRDRAGPVTLVVLVIRGDLPELSDENVHIVKVDAIVDDVLSLQIISRRPAPEFSGSRIDHVVTEL